MEAKRKPPTLLRQRIAALEEHIVGNTIRARRMAGHCATGDDTLHDYGRGWCWQCGACFVFASGSTASSIAHDKRCIIQKQDAQRSCGVPAVKHSGSSQVRCELCAPLTCSRTSTRKRVTKQKYWHVKTVAERVADGCSFDGVHLDPDECKRLLDIINAVRSSRSRNLKQLLAARLDEPGELHDRNN